MFYFVCDQSNSLQHFRKWLKNWSCSSFLLYQLKSESSIEWKSIISIHPWTKLLIADANLGYQCKHFSYFVLWIVILFLFTSFPVGLIIIFCCCFRIRPEFEADETVRFIFYVSPLHPAIFISSNSLLSCWLVLKVWNWVCEDCCVLLLILSLSLLSSVFTLLVTV